MVTALYLNILMLGEHPWAGYHLGTQPNAEKA